MTAMGVIFDRSDCSRRSRNVRYASKSDQIDASRQKHLTHRSKQSSLFDHLVGDAALDFKKELKVPYWVFSETSEGRMVDFLYDPRSHQDGIYPRGAP